MHIESLPIRLLLQAALQLSCFKHLQSETLEREKVSWEKRRVSSRVYLAEDKCTCNLIVKTSVTSRRAARTLSQVEELLRAKVGSSWSLEELRHRVSRPSSRQYSDKVLHSEKVHWDSEIQDCANGNAKLQLPWVLAKRWKRRKQILLDEQDPSMALTSQLSLVNVNVHFDTSKVVSFWRHYNVQEVASSLWDITISRNFSWIKSHASEYIVLSAQGPWQPKQKYLPCAAIVSQSKKVHQDNLSSSEGYEYIEYLQYNNPFSSHLRTWRHAVWYSDFHDRGGPPYRKGTKCHSHIAHASLIGVSSNWGKNDIVQALLDLCTLGKCVGHLFTMIANSCWCIRTLWLWIMGYDLWQVYLGWRILNQSSTPLSTLICLISDSHSYICKLEAFTSYPHSANSRRNHTLIHAEVATL